jgi:hypothetical protein
MFRCLRQFVALVVIAASGIAAGGPGEHPRQEAAAAAAALRAELETGPLGAILIPELELDWAAAEIARDPPDVSALERLERSLRRILPGRAQESLDRLRGRVGRLAGLARRTEQGMAEALAARAALETHLGHPSGASPVTDEAVRAAFAALASVVADEPGERELRRLRERLSSANFSVLLKREFVAAIARREFTQPVEFHERQAGTAIAGTGHVRVAISASVPESRGENRLVVHAEGDGRIAATADRRRVHVAATAVPRVSGSDTVRLTPMRVVVEPPAVAARFTTRVSGLKVDGLVGRCRIVQGIARRAAQETLAGNDPAVASRIERTVAERVEEEATTLATKLNGLLQWGVWDRLAALDFTPEIRLSNDALGMRSDTWYAGIDQLGAVTPRPAIPAADLARLDMVTWVHESAVNNSLAALSGLRLDEATVRGLWEVQCKLSSDEWQRLPAARIPAVIVLATERSAAVRIVPGGIDLALRTTGCELAGRVVDEEPREIRLGYRLDRDAEGWRFTRGEAEFTPPPPADRTRAWHEALGLFLARSIRPLPRYRPSGLAAHMKAGYVDVCNGWLVVGAERADGSEGEVVEAAR